MTREMFLNALDEHNNLTAVVYVGDEIPLKVDMNVMSVEDYDDEIVVRGDRNTFIILPGDPEVHEEPFDETEFVFTQDSYQVGVTCY